MPGITRAWPEGGFYGYDRVYDSRNLGYSGPRFGWSPRCPTSTRCQRSRRTSRTGRPRAADGRDQLISSHTPWAPIPRPSTGTRSATARVVRSVEPPGPRATLWGPPQGARPSTRKSIVYSLRTLTRGSRRTATTTWSWSSSATTSRRPNVTGGTPNHDVPITIVAKDPACSTGWPAGAGRTGCYRRGHAGVEDERLPRPVPDRVRRPGSRQNKPLTVARRDRRPGHDHVGADSLSVAFGLVSGGIEPAGNQPTRLGSRAAQLRNAAPPRSRRRRCVRCSRRDRDRPVAGPGRPSRRGRRISP